ncbi:MAG TPA: 2,3-bisphosphoglycerate-independent phosphoglycerate mutase [Gaiellaceae bacterium]|nr:2,3-bisphosphoglycerate-independent phosphoglycerate mutase [Gaiellaceae bacterium]
MPGSYPLVALVILDGFGCAPPGRGNAVDLAETPVFDRLWREFPHTTIEASGEAAGLPPGQMGNSEVGHLTIGSGRRLYQDLMRVNRSIEDGSFFEIPALVSAFERGKRVHLMGLVSHGGVHSHIDHLQALLRFAPEKTWIHAFTDGRDVSPTSAVKDLALLPLDRLATVTGRYYAMDRDKRWERTQRAFDAIVHRRCSCTFTSHDLLAEVQRNYAAGTTDEFLEPICVEGAPPLEAGDAAIFFNFRPDRGRQLTRMLLDHGFDVTTMTRYAADLETPVAFEEQDVEETLAEVLAEHDLKQLHAAETEKYAHVTYFFNGGREEAWPGEERVLVPSPRDVASYDLKPEMSAGEVADEVVRRLGDGYAFCVVNFANPDMVGHTGSIPAVITACETADRVLGRVAERVAELGGVCLVTADHGNAEKMLEPDGESPHTAHTTSPVPLVLTVSGAELREQGEIADLAPTVLDLLGIGQPSAMTGRSLVKRR